MATRHVVVRMAALAVVCASTGVGCRSEVQAYEAVNGNVELAEYKGRRAIHLVASADKRSSDMDLLAIAKGSSFREGTIQLDVAGTPFEGIDGARGFIGVAFHVEPGGSRYECFYLRPTNGRADDQLRRNHATQYVSHPDFPWQRLRQSNPGVYESYADVQPGTWTTLKVVVEGKTARLFVNRADQPALVVHDLKLGEAAGAVALWAHPSTDAYFSRLEIVSR